MIRVTWHLGRQHGVRDTIRHLTTDGHIIDLQWLRPVNHDSGSHKPDFLISNDSEVQVAIEAKNWAPIPELPRITQEILTRYVAFRNVPYKILVITTPIPSDAKSLLTAENIVIVLVYPQILSNGDLPQIAKIKSALLGQLP
jgi:hypothetical protein